MARWPVALCVVGALFLLAPHPARAAYTYLSGYVRGASGGGPIEDATIGATVDGVQWTETTSYPDGAYSLYLWLPDDVPSVSFEVRYKAFGYRAATLTIEAQPDVGVRRNVRLALSPRYAVSGVVRDADDATPIAGAAVRLKDTPLAPSYTDATGAFVIPDVPSGRYEIEASHVCRKARTRTIGVQQDETAELRLRPASDAFGHACEELAFEWVEGRNPLTDWGELPLPFPLFFYGRRQTTIQPVYSGYATFGPPQSVTYFNTSLPNSMGAGLYPFWDDIGGGWRTSTVGEAPDRTFVLEYVNGIAYPERVPVTFEVLLHERDSSIVFQYRGDATGRSATIGIQNADGTDAFQLGFENAVLHDGVAVRLTPPVIDTDADGVPEQIDRCPTTPDPEQRDLDDDGRGDACDDDDGGVRPTHLTVRRSTSAQRANGRLALDGEVLLRGSDDALAAPDGLTIRIVDALQLDETVQWTGPECKAKPDGGVRCRSARAPHQTAVITRLPSDIPGFQNALVKVRLSGLDLAAPFVGPVRVTMTSDPRSPGLGVDRIGTLTECFARTYGLECTNGRAGSASRAFLVDPPPTVLE